MAREAIPLNRSLDRIAALQANVEKVIRGKSEVVQFAIASLLAKGHILLEDVPGVGKTTLAHAIARSMSLQFQRIQFTSDLLPADIVGVTIFNQDLQEFEFVSGPVFTNVLLADEINRTTPSRPCGRRVRCDLAPVVHRRTRDESEPLIEGHRGRARGAERFRCGAALACPRVERFDQGAAGPGAARRFVDVEFLEEGQPSAVQRHRQQPGDKGADGPSVGIGLGDEHEAAWVGQRVAQRAIVSVALGQLI